MPDLPTGGLNRPSGRAAPREQEQTLVGWNRCLGQLGLHASVLSRRAAWSWVVGLVSYKIKPAALRAAAS
jgi:hypothetical protein